MAVGFYVHQVAFESCGEVVGGCFGLFSLPHEQTEFSARASQGRLLTALSTLIVS